MYIGGWSKKKHDQRRHHRRRCSGQGIEVENFFLGGGRNTYFIAETFSLSEIIVVISNYQNFGFYTNFPYTSQQRLEISLACCLSLLSKLHRNKCSEFINILFCEYVLQPKTETVRKRKKEVQDDCDGQIIAKCYIHFPIFVFYKKTTGNRTEH